MGRLIAVLLLFASAFAQAADLKLVTLGYHDVRDNLANNYDPDRYAITSENLASHFRWLRSQNYQVVSIDQVLAALDGSEPLPDKAVLLSFDDGFQSVYTHVFPLLKAFDYPAVVSPVTSWIESDVTVEYEGELLGRNDFVTWEQMREMQASGLVEIASHTDDLHRGIRGNPQGNLEPAAITLKYGDDGYETEEQYQARIAADLVRSAELIRENIGHAPRVITWPYGAWNDPIRSIAARNGMVLSLTLEEIDVSSIDGVIGREIIVSNPGIPRFAGIFEPSNAVVPVRAAQVDLDYVYDPDPERQEANLGLLLDRIKALQISHVFLQAFSDTDGDGAAESLYFPNRHMPMRADLFNRAAWQLRTRANVDVFAWLPLTAFRVDGHEDWQVLQARDGQVLPDPAGEPRLSVFVPEARQFILDIYHDLAIHAPFQGVHFHDDGRLNEFEDANPAALKAFSNLARQSFSIEQAIANPSLQRAWAMFKAAALTAFSQELAAVLRTWHPGLKTSRNLFANAILMDGSVDWLAQDYDEYLTNYDYVTVMAMPRFEGVENEDQFYTDLINAVGARAGGLPKTVFQLQTVDWRVPAPIPSDELRDTMRSLKSQGISNLAYYPDDFIAGHPEIEPLREGISLAETPWESVR